MSKLRHNTVLECPLCGSQHVTDHCKSCDWWCCRKCGAFGVPGGNHYIAQGKPA